MARQRRRTGRPDYRFSYLLFALGAAAAALGAWGAWQGAQTLSWPRVSATIVDARLTQHESRGRDLQRPDHWNTFSVRYLYTVDGRDRLGGGLEPYDFGMQNSAGARRMQERFPVGATAPLAYDPRDPSVSYLLPGPSSFSLILLAIGVIFGLSGALARRMIRVGPGDDEPSGPTRAAGPAALDPKIAGYYPPRQP